MASFLKRWFGGRPAIPGHLTAPLAELEKLTSDRSTLQTSCQVLAAILLELFSEPAPTASVSLAPDAAHLKLTAGIPLLHDQPLPIDPTSFRTRALAVCGALNQAEANAIADALRKQAYTPVGLLQDVLAGRPEIVAIQAEANGVDPSLLASVLRYAALPALAEIAQAIAPLRQGIAWNYGYCPTCGSWPLLGETRGLEQLRYLRCGLCATAWEFGRFRCVFCGNQDHRKLSYLHVEGEEDRCKAATCDDCHGYVKWLSTLSAFSVPQLLVMDLASLHLDLVAADRGFLVPGG